MPKFAHSWTQIQPIPLGATFSNAVSKLKAQSSNVCFYWNVAKETFEPWAFELSKMSPQVELAVQTLNECLCCHILALKMHMWAQPLQLPAQFVKPDVCQNGFTESSIDNLKQVCGCFNARFLEGGSNLIERNPPGGGFFRSNLIKKAPYLQRLPWRFIIIEHW